MYSAPLRRRIIPWIFAAAFFIVTPVVIFYTSGYRWNEKKGLVEHNGTLIVDSSPSGATVYLNDQNTDETTPITFQNLQPGRYRIRLEKSGYSSWGKTLDVRAEQVTFANEVSLWKNTIPESFLSIRGSTLCAAPNGRWLAITSVHASSTVLDLYRPSNAEQIFIPIPAVDVQGSPIITWAENSKEIFLKTSSKDQIDGWRIALDTQTVHALGTVYARYEHSSLIYSGSATQTRSFFDGAVLETPTSSDAQTFYLASRPKEHAVLPGEHWNIYAHMGPFYLLQNNRAWLSLNPDAPSAVYRATGDLPRFSPVSKHPLAILLDGGELWSWNLASDPELLIRESTPIVQARWLETGSDLLVATPTQLFILNLDPRGGYIRIPLATFDQINDVDLIGSTAYILGKYQGTDALWKMELE